MSLALFAVLFAAGAFAQEAPTSWHIPAPRVELVGAGEAAGTFGPPDSLAPPPLPRPDLPEFLPFGPGERLTFSVDYGVINAGWAVMEIPRTRRYVGVECLDIRSEANSNAFFSKIHKVRDRAQTLLDPDALLPLRFEKHQREGDYSKDLVVKFDRREHFARYENGDEVMMHPWAQDELSAFYYLRTLPLAEGRDVFIDNHTNRKNYPLRVVVHGRETVEVAAGTFDCWVVEPVIREGGIFQAKGTLTIWLSADERRIPVKMRTKIVVGAITVSLVEYEPAERWRRRSAAGAAGGGGGA
ncbi:MAG: DUF3108 domain-containing protein [Candidatus Eiseniibacteriota bacterium]